MTVMLTLEALSHQKVAQRNSFNTLASQEMLAQVSHNSYLSFFIFSLNLTLKFVLIYFTLAC